MLFCNSKFRSYDTSTRIRIRNRIRKALPGFCFSFTGFFWLTVGCVGIIWLLVAYMTPAIDPVASCLFVICLQFTLDPACQECVGSADRWGHFAGSCPDCE